MYHYAMHMTRHTLCPVMILKAAKENEIDISKVWRKEPYTIMDAPAEFVAISAIISSLKLGMDVGMVEYASCFKREDEYAEEPANVEKVVVDLTGIEKYRFNNINILQELFKVTKGDMETAKFAFDVLLSIACRQGD